MDPKLVLISLCVVAGLPADAWMTVSVRDVERALRRRFAFGGIS